VTHFLYALFRPCNGLSTPSYNLSPDSCFNPTTHSPPCSYNQHAVICIVPSALPVGSARVLRTP
jgi:hypothetical protein